MLGMAASAGQVLIDPGGCRINITGQHIPGHEGDDVLACILPRLETVYAFDNVQAAEFSVVSGNPLTLNNRVRVVHLVCLTNILEMNGNVRPSIRR